MTHQELEARLAQAQAFTRLLHQQNTLQLQAEMFKEVLERLSKAAGVDIADIAVRFEPLFNDSLRALEASLSEQEARFRLGMLEWSGENAIPPQAEMRDRPVDPFDRPSVE